MSRVGVLGGTFDPLHLGHLRAAEAVADALQLDRVVFVPAASPPHKPLRRVTDMRHRVAMLEAAIVSERTFEVSLVEVKRGGRSYTIDTLRELQGASPETRFCFITGTDAFVEIQTWRAWQELLSEFSFAVHERPGCTIDEVHRQTLPAGARVTDETTMGIELDEPRIFVLRRPMLDVSSTEIRDSVKKKQSIRYLVPDPVADYIEENRLYE